MTIMKDWFISHSCAVVTFSVIKYTNTLTRHENGRAQVIGHSSNVRGHVMNGRPNDAVGYVVM